MRPILTNAGLIVHGSAVDRTSTVVVTLRRDYSWTDGRHSKDGKEVLTRISQMQ